MPVTISGTTGITGPDGSASTPSLAGADSNTGVFFPAADTVAIATNGAERARIDSLGTFSMGSNVEAGTPAGEGLQFSPKNALGPLYWGVTDTTSAFVQFRFRNGNGTVGQISTENSSTIYATSSDYRLKEAVQPMTGALARVASLKPITYKWKVDGSDGEGFIAHELQEIVPGCVTGEKDAVDEDGKPVHQGIDTSFLVATLTAAIQEQQALITSLTARIAALEAA